MIAPMLIVFTDLDGTLLDSRDCAWIAARPALEVLDEMGTPVVFCTSKTRAETEYWRKQIGNRHPFIVENGGAMYVPSDYFALSFQAPVYRDGYAVIEFGDPYSLLVEVLREASVEADCRVTGFHDLTKEEISLRYGMTLEQAGLAKCREYDEPFEILDPHAERLLNAIERRGKRWMRGGRFHHIVGANDKAHSVRLLSHFYERAFGKVTAVGLGDGMNDVAFLSAVDIPIVIKSAASSRLHGMVRNSRVTDLPGPAGWNRAILEICRNRRLASNPLQPQPASAFSQ